LQQNGENRYVPATWSADPVPRKSKNGNGVIGGIHPRSGGRLPVVHVSVSSGGQEP
jgi:hypothetical protein